VRFKRALTTYILPMKYLLVALYISVATLSIAQTDTIVLSAKDLVKQEIENYQSVLDSLNKQLAEIKKSEITYPHWKMKVGAIGGLDLNNFSNWANRGADVNSSAASITLGGSAKADLIGKHSFWRNRGRLLIGWQRFDRGEGEETQVQKTADILQIGSHYGRNIIDGLAMSVLSEWESNLIDQTINPSYLDMSLGLTWTPNDYFSSVIHPVNYELALAEEDQFESSLGAKLVFEYNQQVDQYVNLASSFSGFLSYEEIEILSNYTWTNRLNVKLIKSLGLAMEYALRMSQQETVAIGLNDDHVQSYFLMGLSFEI